MAINVLSKATASVPLNEVTAKKFLRAAGAGAKHLGWKVTFVDDDFMTADTPDGRVSGQTVSLVIDKGTALFKSESRAGRLAQSQLNKQNLRKLQHEISERLQHFYHSQNAVDQDDNDDAGHNALKAEHNAAERRKKDDHFYSGSKWRDWLYDWLYILMPQEGYRVTAILFDLNILVFLAMCLSGAGIFDVDGDVLLRWGANYRPATLEGEWWRLVTCCFVHVGIVHIVMNMYGLLLVGFELEPLIGSWRFALVYLLLGVASSMTSISVHPMTVSAGASGAIFGLFGVYFAILTTNFVEKQKRHEQLLSFGLLILYSIAGSTKEGIDMAAHASGLLYGLLMGYAMLPALYHPSSVIINTMSLGIISFFSLGMVRQSYLHLPNTEKIYEQNMERFSTLEKSALGIYSLADSLPHEELLRRIHDQGVQNWESAGALLRATDTLQLSDDLHDHIRRLERYTDVRLYSTGMYYRAKSEKSSEYNDSLIYYRSRVKAILDTINGRVKN